MKNRTEYSVYGLNNAISILSSKKYIINSIIIMNGSVAESNSQILEPYKKSKIPISFS